MTRPLRSLRNRLTLIFGLIVAGAIGIVYFYVVPQLESSLTSEKLDSLKRDAANYSGPLQDAIGRDVTGRELDSLTRRISEQADAGVTLLGIPRNELDSVAYRVSKALEEAGASVAEHDRARAEMLVEEARQAVEGDEPVERLRALTGELHQMGQVLSTATRRGDGGPSAGSASASDDTTESDDDDVIDAEFTAH